LHLKFQNIIKMNLPFTILSLLEKYRSGEFTPSALIESLLPRLDADDPTIWIHRVPSDDLLLQAKVLENADPESLPLYGIPFAVKDNVDVAGMPTTAACPEFAYVAEEHAYVVKLLLEAGAILVGKTNLDQFATGLVGARSPYGVPDNAFNKDYIPGGSSSGSAVAVAKGFVCFSLGTDTAGSGRVPASFNNLIGFKPTRGRVSCRGVVPACRSLDCVSVFGLQSADVAKVWSVIGDFDPEDVFAREEQPATKAVSTTIPKVAIPIEEQLQFFGDEEAKLAYERSQEVLWSTGAEVVPVDLDAFFQAANLLYGGPWVAERYIATTPIIEENPHALLPETRKIIGGGKQPSAVESFSAQYQLAKFRRLADKIWQEFDFVVLPTTGTIYTKEAVANDPIQLNTNLGYYTNFMNLLDLCGCAVPTTFREDGLPTGLTVFAPAFSDAAVLEFSQHLHQLAKVGGGVFRDLQPATLPAESSELSIDVFVCGAHMQGLPLNWQLTDLGAVFLGEVTAAPCYRMVLLPPTETLPPRPGMIRVDEATQPLPGELWRMPSSGFGQFMQKIKFPLGISQVQLSDGTSRYGFACDAQALVESKDITEFGGWRAYLKSNS
jgi:allophanate hydrolase